MLAWLSENISTIIIAAVLILIIALIIRKFVKDKREGRSSCGCGCSSCAMSESCHGKKK